MDKKPAAPLHTYLADISKGQAIYLDISRNYSGNRSKLYVSYIEKK